MECVVVQDLFLNETAKYAHVFLPGSSFLEKDGTFTNAERRISACARSCRRWRARPTGKSRWRWPGLGYPMHYDAPVRDHGRDRALTPTFAGVSYAQARPPRQHPVAVQRGRARGHAVMHVGGFVRGKGRFMITEYVPTEEKVTRRFPLLLTTGRILSSTTSARRRGAPPTPGTTPRTCWRSTRTTPRSAASATATGSAS
jgi:formate dehydrogenase major subunit